MDLTHLHVEIVEERIVCSVPATRRRREPTLDGQGTVQMYEGPTILERAPLVGVAHVWLVSFVTHSGEAQHWNVFATHREGDSAFQNLMDIHEESS